MKNLWLFNDAEFEREQFSLEAVWESNEGDHKIIAMGEEEEAYLFSMQLMLGAMTVIPFQKFHDDLWEYLGDRKKHPTIQDFMRGNYFCSDPNLMDYLYSNYGDLAWAKKHREKKHWSQPEQQTSVFLGGIFS